MATTLIASRGPLRKTAEGECYAVDLETRHNGSRAHESEIAVFWVKAETEEARAIARKRADLFVEALSERGTLEMTSLAP